MHGSTVSEQTHDDSCYGNDTNVDAIQKTVGVLHWITVQNLAFSLSLCLHGLPTKLVSARTIGYTGQ